MNARLTLSIHVNNKKDPILIPTRTFISAACTRQGEPVLKVWMIVTVTSAPGNAPESTVGGSGDSRFL